MNVLLHKADLHREEQFPLKNYSQSEDHGGNGKFGKRNKYAKIIQSYNL